MKVKIFIRKEVSCVLVAASERGQGLVEYSLIIVLIALLLIVALGLLTGALCTVFSRVASVFP
jgi:Flp pilus assembly pilin Flp